QRTGGQFSGSGLIGGVRVGVVGQEGTGTAAPGRARGTGHTAVQGDGGVVGAKHLVHAGVHHRGRREGDHHLVRGGQAVAVARGGQRQRHTATGDLTGRGHVHGAHVGGAGVETAGTTAPHRTGGHGEGPVQLGRRVVGAHHDVRSRIGRGSGREGVGHLVAHRVAVAMTSAGEREGHAAAGDLIGGGSVGGVWGRVVRRPGAVATAPKTARGTDHAAVQRDRRVVAAHRTVGARVHDRCGREGEGHLVRGGQTVAIARRGQRQGQRAGGEFGRGGLIGGVERAVVRREHTGAAAPYAARGHAHATVQRDLRVVGAERLVGTGVGRGGRGEVQLYLIAHRQTVAVARGRQRQHHTAAGDLGRRGGVYRVDVGGAGV